MSEKNRAHALLKCKKPWDDNDNTIWLATTLRLRRNIEKFNFPGKLQDDKKKQIASLVSKGLLSNTSLSGALAFKADEIDSLEKEYLLEHYLAMQSFHDAHSTEAFIIDTSGSFLAILNVHDHLQLQITNCKGEIEESWKQLVAIETALGSAINYAYTPKFGFLTADPAQCGTGFIIHAFLHLPSLIHTGQLQSIMQKVCGEGIATTGLQGDPLNLIGDVLVLHNSFTLGLTEEDIISSVTTALTKLMIAEKSARTAIRNKNETHMRDLVSRAYGLLSHSYQIETIEAMNALSLLKLGLDLQWLEGIDNRTLNALFFNCRKAHLITQFKEETASDQLGHRRAEFIHTALKPAKMKDEG